MVDLRILRLLKYKEQHFKYVGRIPANTVTKQTKTILDCFSKYFSKFPDDAKVESGKFMTMFRLLYPKLTDEALRNYSKMIKSAEKDLDKQTEAGLIATLTEVRMANELLTALDTFNEGELENLHQAVETISMEYALDAGLKTTDFIRDSIGDLIQQEIDDSGLSWRLSCLNQSMKGLRPGDFGIVAGRPDRGKTTFVASEVTHMAAQLPKTRPVVWLNNEGLGNKIVFRLYQAALGITVAEMTRMHELGELEEAYNKYMGDKWKVRVFDVHGADTYKVERIIEKHTPGLVVYDMIDNIRGFGDSARQDLQLERMYQWGRELCVKYDCIGMATSQISAEGEGMQFPGMSMLKDSKTGKQGACDYQIMIGSTNDPTGNDIRYVSVPKNKLHRQGGPRDPRCAVSYKPEIARYINLEEVTTDE